MPEGSEYVLPMSVEIMSLLMIRRESVRFEDGQVEFPVRRLRVKFEARALADL